MGVYTVLTYPWQDAVTRFIFGEGTMSIFLTQRPVCAAGLALGLLCAMGWAQATGLATCDSGDKSTWQPKEKLEQTLKDRGWTVRRIKEDGGCYEVYALDEKGQRGEYYFHPVTLESVPTKPRN
jgi:hypothetical protein